MSRQRQLFHANLLAPKRISQLKALGFCFEATLASKLRWKRERSASHAAVHAGLRGGGLDPKIAKRQREFARMSVRNYRGEAAGKTRLSVAAKAVRIKGKGARGQVRGEVASLLGSPARALLMLGGNREAGARAEGVASSRDQRTASFSKAADAASRAGAARAKSAAALGKEAGDGAGGVEDMLVRALLGAHDKVEKRLGHSLFNLHNGVGKASGGQESAPTDEVGSGGASGAVQGGMRAVGERVGRSRDVGGSGVTGGRGCSGGIDRQVDKLILGDKWLEYFRQLKSFKARYGHDAVSKSVHRNPHFMLGRWTRCVSMHVCNHVRVCFCVGLNLT